MNLVFDNNTPIYIQLVEKIEKDIITGKLKGGERLPSIRDLAIESKVNPNTIQKALSVLEETGLIFTERTNGKFITKDKALIEKYKNEYAEVLSQKYFEDMQSIGLGIDLAIKYIKRFGGKE